MLIRLLYASNLIGCGGDLQGILDNQNPVCGCAWMCVGMCGCTLLNVGVCGCI